MTGWLGLKIEYIYAKPYAHNNIQNDRYFYSHLFICFQNVLSFYRFSFSTINVMLVSIFRSRFPFEKERKNRKEKKKNREENVCSSKNKTMRKEKIWAAIFIFSISIVLPAHVLWQTVSIQLFMHVFGIQTFCNLFFSHCIFPLWLSTSINVCKTAWLLWIRDSKSIDIN